MKTVHNLIIILLIIGFSYLFETSCNYEFNSQLTFILLSLFIIVIYKFLVNKCIVKENFNSFTDEINDFLNTNVSSKASDKQIQSYQDNLNKLQDKVDIMNEYLKEIKDATEQRSTGNDIGNQLNIQASQQIQDFRIREIQKEIERTTDLIKESKMRDDAAKFKKIPVYSSCVMSNADGSMQVDSPSSGSTREVISDNRITTQTTRDPVTGVIINQETGRKINNIEDKSPVVNKRTVSSQLGNMIKSVLENGVNVNINTE